jgi:hypothetical protein
MKHFGVVGVLCVALFVLSGITASSASGAWICYEVSFFWLAGYGADGPVGEQCAMARAIPRFGGYDLFQTTGSKEIEPGVLCALVEAGEPSAFDGPNCGKAEEHEGTGEYGEAIMESRCDSSDDLTAGRATQTEVSDTSGEILSEVSSEEQLLKRTAGLGGRRRSIGLWVMPNVVPEPLFDFSNDQRVS